MMPSADELMNHFLCRATANFFVALRKLKLCSYRVSGDAYLSFEEDRYITSTRRSQLLERLELHQQIATRSA